MGRQVARGTLPAASLRRLFMEKLGPYVLIGKLATGGMAEVYLARREGPAGFEKLGVLKRILPQLTQDPEFRKMFLDEARLAALINHPNVVQIFELSEQRDELYIAMEYVPGFDLAKVMDASLKARRLVPAAIGARIVADASAGLDFAHRLTDARGNPKGIIHRDISPENLLVSEVGQVKVVDFGIARATTGHLTATGRLKGKMHYHAPENIKNQPLDGRADVYALGVVLYELLCARRPFEGLNEAEVMRATVEQAAPPPAKYYPPAEPQLSEIALSALSREVETRPTAGELRDLLETWLHQNPCSAADIERYLTETIPADAPERARVRKLLEDAPDRERASSDPIPRLPTRPLPSTTPGATTDIASRGIPAKAILLGSASLAAAALAAMLYAWARSPPASSAAVVPTLARTGEGAPPVADAGAHIAQVESQPSPPDHPVERARAIRKHPASPSAVGTGTLTVITQPPSEVAIDDEPPIQAPFYDREVTPGRHRLRIVHREPAIEAFRQVTVARNQATKRNFELARIPVMLDVYPWAEVFVDGQHRGATPLDLTLYEGKHELQLKYAGQTKRYSLLVKEGASNHVQAHFAKR